MTNPDGSLYIGEVWPGYTVFPDWIGDGAGSWWTNEVSMWHDNIYFDGIWIDMSEVSSFCIGSCGSVSNKIKFFRKKKFSHPTSSCYSFMSVIYVCLY